MSVLFHRISLIGLGLIGASLAHVIRREGLAEHIAGFAPTAKTRVRARELNLTDSIHESLAAAVRDADLVILCAPPGAFAAISQTMAPALKKGAVISDVGSFKEKAIADIRPHLPPSVFFVPAHPIAGTEHSGPDAGFASLFENHWCVLTPLENETHDYQKAVARVKEFWQSVGSKIAIMNAAHHDRVLALTSHLPHVIAWTMVAAAQTLSGIEQREVIDYSGGGFRDFTRLASSDPIMWRDVLLGNRLPVLEMIDHFIAELQKIRSAIDSDDGDFLESLFAQTRSMRGQIVAAGQDSSAPNFGRDS